MHPTISSRELAAFLDQVASAPVALRDVPRVNDILARLCGLASGDKTIGDITAAAPESPPPGL